MAVPSYTTDLITLSTANDDVNWDESSNALWDDAGTNDPETNFYIQNVECISTQFTKSGQGTIIYGHGSSVTIPTDGAVLVWHFWASPPSLSTLANGGVKMLIGNSFGDFKAWDCSGSDFEPSPIGGWYNYATDPSITADDTVGTVATPYSHFGAAVNATAQARGNPHACDAIRYGRCEARYNGGQSGGYATFLGFAALDNSSANKWALLSDIPGVPSGYRWQGLITLGYVSLVDFRDANKNIFVANVLNTSANFNRIEIKQATSNIEWTSISIASAGTVSRGQFEMIDNAVVTMYTCGFTDMDTFIFLSNADINTTTFRRCNQVTLGGATMAGCSFANTTAPIALACGSSIATLSDTSFQSDGSSHGIEITSGLTHTLDNLTFTGYEAYNVNGTSTGNEAVYINIGAGAVTLYANSLISYRTAGATVSIIVNPVDVSITAIAVDGSAVNDTSMALYAKDGTGDLPFQESVTISNSGTTATVTHTAHAMVSGDKTLIQGGDQPYNRGTFSIIVTGINTYTYTTSTAPSGNPTGCVSTWASIYEVATGTNTVTKSRTFTSNQPVSGWARKTTSSPLYQTAPISGIISTTLGINLTALMLSDE